MSRNTEEEIQQYNGKIITCPRCKREGRLTFRKEHGRTYWTVRHGHSGFDDKFCHVGTFLPIHIKDIINGRKLKTLGDF